MSLRTFESLKLKLTDDKCPFIVTATGLSMEPVGFTQCSFNINGHSFMQKLIVCSNQTRPIILGKDFASKNCIGVIWTKQGSRKMVDADCKIIMEVHEQTTDIPLSLSSSIRIPPHTIAVAVVECARPMDSTMDIRADAAFLTDFPNIHVACSYINNPKESLAPNCIPFAFTNLSMHSQYLGKDKVVGFAQPTAEDVEVHTLADHDELTEMMQGPRNHIPHKQQAKYKLPIIPLDNAFLTSPADVPGPRKVDLQDADITPCTRSTFDTLCEKYPKVFSKRNEYIGRTQLVTMLDKLDTIHDMPAPHNCKEVKQFLGLVGYYRKFVQGFADLSRPLTRLTCKDRIFEWTHECRKAFNILKQNLCVQPILKYTDTSKGYTLYTDASKFGWAGFLTQAHTSIVEGKKVTTDHPVAYVSGLFRGSQLNWAALTKEAFAIYMSVKKLSFYLTDADVLLKSDHLPLKKFLQKNTLNNKVNNWAMELQAFNIRFKHVSGKANILADTLSHLVDIDPNARLDPEIPVWVL